MSLLVDHSNLAPGRKITGIERVALDMFSAEALAPLPADHVRALGKGAVGMVGAQILSLPARTLFDQNALVLCPGFPPSVLLTLIGGDRVIAYIHDLFLLTRPEELNIRAKLYMRPGLKAAITRLKYFLTNSEYTAGELRKWARKDSEIRLMRPQARNGFGLSPDARTDKAPGEPLRLLTISTIEPRKNLLAAAAIRRQLEAKLGRPTYLTIIGREGWGDDAARLRDEPNVFMPGYLPMEDVRRLANEADFFISTSNDEGLGLPLLEVQYGGLAVVASDIPVFREVLGESGLLINSNDAESAADAIARMIAEPGWRHAQSLAATANLSRWNSLAARDANEFKLWLMQRLGMARA